MKKIKLEGKLNLNKETISKLNNAQMKEIKGDGKIKTSITTIINFTQQNCAAPQTLNFEECVITAFC